jgi:enterobacteria phage integrase
MKPAELAGLLEMLAAGLRALPADYQPASAQAVNALQAIAAAAPAPAAPPAEPARTVADWLKIHSEDLAHRGYKVQTLRNHRTLLAHCTRLWGTVPIAELKPRDIAAGLRSFTEEQSSTAGRVLGAMRDALTEAVANDWAASNPAMLVKRPKHKVQRERLRFQTWAEMRTLAQAGPQRWVESMLLLAAATGQRRADLAKMKFSDIVTEADGQQYLRVQQQKEAGKGYGARLAIPLSLRLDAIDMTLAEVIEHCRGSAKPGETLLRKAGGGRIEVSSLTTRFCECIVAVLGDADPGPRKRPSLHEARSLSARLYLAQGLPPVTVQTLLGHKDLEMTQLYADDRGLSAHEYKRVALPAAKEPLASA